MRRVHRSARSVCMYSYRSARWAIYIRRKDLQRVNAELTRKRKLRGSAFRNSPSWNSSGLGRSTDRVGQADCYLRSGRQLERIPSAVYRSASCERIQATFKYTLSTAWHAPSCRGFGARRWEERWCGSALRPGPGSHLLPGGR